MKKLLGIFVLWFLITNVSFADTVGFYKIGKGPLKVTKHIADRLEYYFSGGRRGKWASKKNAWRPAFIVISSDGRHEFHYVKSIGQGSTMPNHYIGIARKACKKKSGGKECFLFAKGYKIVWDNGSDKKRRRLKQKEIMNGQTLQILQELGFYDGGITQTKKTQKVKKKISKKTSQTDDNNDIVKQIKELKELYDSGVLTKEEFEKAKKKLLN